MRQLRPFTFPHPKYSDDAEKQKAMEEGIDAMTASILDLVSAVIHKRLTQFAQIISESIEEKKP